jgi:hypothetical protein
MPSLFRDLRLPLNGSQNEDIHHNVSEIDGGENPISDRRPLPPTLTLLLALLLFLSGVKVEVWAGDRFAWDIGRGWVILAGGISGWCLMMSAFCVLVWGGILS